MDILDFAWILQVAVKAGGLRARALGPLQTPSWGALEPRVDFTVPVEVGYQVIVENWIDNMGSLC